MFFAFLMRFWTFDLLLASAAILVTGSWYAWLSLAGAPRPSSTIGLGLGIVGLLLMLAAETLYTLRKQTRLFRFAPMSAWLQLHIFAGLVGSWLALLHTGGKFHGLAGVAAGVTVAMVASGFVGRFIYTAVPRTIDGLEVDIRDLYRQISDAERRLQTLGVPPTAAVVALIRAEPPTAAWYTVLGRTWLLWRQRRRVHRAVRTLNLASRSTALEIERLLYARYEVQLEIQSLAATRRLLARWHLFHVPLGLALFTLALVHIVSALYYVTWRY